MGRRAIVNPIWFEPEDRRKSMRATMTSSGVLCIGKTMRGKLQGGVRVGLLAEEKALVIASAETGGFALNQTGRVTLTRLSAQLMELDILLPCRFVFTWDEHCAFWKGVVDPLAVQRQAATGEQLLHAYSWLIEKVVAQCAKSTPVEERRANARMAFLQFAGEWTEACGPFEPYIIRRIKGYLTEENRQYADQFDPSITRLDTVPKGFADGSPTTYHEIVARPETDFADVEQKDMEDRFAQECLTPQQSDIFYLLQDGYSVREIARQCDVSPLELEEICAEIGALRANYTGE